MRSGSRQAVRLAAISAAARAPAFLIPVAIATVFGAGRETDAYFLAYAAVLLVGGTLAQGVEQATVPFAARELQRLDGDPRAYLNRAAVRTAQAAGALWLLVVPVLLVAAPGYVGRRSLLFAAAFAPLAVLWCASAVYTGTLIARFRIGTATGSMLWRGLGALAGFATVPLGGGLWSVALGLGAGEWARLAWVRRRALDDSVPAGGAASAPLHGLRRAALAQVAASAAIGAAPFVERVLAGSLGVGSVSHLEYAMRLLVVPAVVFEGALAPMLLARWTGYLTAGRGVHLRSDVLPPLLRGGAVALVCGAAVFVLAPLAVRLILGHGRFTVDDTAAVMGLLRWLAPGFAATMTALLVERIFLAAARNRTLAVLSFGRVALRLLVVMLLLPSQRLLAFAIGYAVADWAYLLVLGLLLPRVLRGRSGPAAA